MDGEEFEEWLRLARQVFPPSDTFASGQRINGTVGQTDALGYLDRYLIRWPHDAADGDTNCLSLPRELALLPSLVLRPQQFYEERLSIGLEDFLPKPRRTLTGDALRFQYTQQTGSLLDFTFWQQPFLELPLPCRIQRSDEYAFLEGQNLVFMEMPDCFPFPLRDLQLCCEQDQVVIEEEGPAGFTLAEAPLVSWYEIERIACFLSSMCEFFSRPADLFDRCYFLHIPSKDIQLDIDLAQLVEVPSLMRLESKSKVMPEPLSLESDYSFLQTFNEIVVKDFKPAVIPLAEEIVAGGDMLVPEALHLIANYGALQDYKMMGRLRGHGAVIVEREFGPPGSRLLLLSPDSVCAILSESDLNQDIVPVRRLAKNCLVVLLLSRNFCITKGFVSRHTDLVASGCTVAIFTDMEPAVEKLVGHGKRDFPLQEGLSSHERFLTSLDPSVNYARAQELLSGHGSLKEALLAVQGQQS